MTLGANQSSSDAGKRGTLIGPFRSCHRTDISSRVERSGSAITRTQTRPADKSWIPIQRIARLRRVDNYSAERSRFRRCRRLPCSYCAADAKGKSMLRRGKPGAPIPSGRWVPWRAGGNANRYVDWRSRILALRPSWAKARGISERSFRYLRRTLRSGRIPRGHGTRTFTRVCEALAAEQTKRTLT